MGLISTGKAAERLGVTVTTVQRYLKDGTLRGTRTPGGHWRVDESSVTRYEVVRAGGSSDR